MMNTRGSVAIEPDGQIVVAGYTLANGSNYDFALWRINIDGSVDTGFGTGGKVTTDFGGANDFGWSVAIEPDGQIVVAGQAYNGSDGDFALARYNSDGSLDTTFDTDGKVTTDFAGGSDYGWSVAIQAGGQIVVAGQAYGGSTVDFALARSQQQRELGYDFRHRRQSDH